MVTNDYHEKNAYKKSAFLIPAFFFAYLFDVLILFIRSTMNLYRIINENRTISFGKKEA